MMLTASTPITMTYTPPQPSQEKVFTQTAMGLVGTGRTPQDARRDLMEKIKQAGEI
ncbi:hypothetical protein LZK73_21960 [Neorhizobium galegae]|nr:hypothetical protein LZK73_21960 [Neorhizobium galegae]